MISNTTQQDGMRHHDASKISPRRQSKRIDATKKEKKKIAQVEKTHNTPGWCIEKDNKHTKDQAVSNKQAKHSSVQKQDHRRKS